ncbi:MAG: hypothetical protein HY644_08300 [Acidobacteria bacterium]|nr:hypothetical protein [Acidobacteriota bacterium]
MAKVLRVDETTVSKWELGWHRPTKRNQLKIQKYFCSSQPASQRFHRSVIRLSISFR